jgi:cystathionine beta-lyase/cystathionine gamma-synthase
MAACAAVLGRLPMGAHLVIGDDCYQGVAGIADAGSDSHQWRVERLPVTDPRWLQRASEADLLWLESPSNPGQEHIPPGLIRLSAGCEDLDDLWQDLHTALKR